MKRSREGRENILTRMHFDGLVHERSRKAQYYSGQYYKINPLFLKTFITDSVTRYSYIILDFVYIQYNNTCIYGYLIYYTLSNGV